MKEQEIDINSIQELRNQQMVPYQRQLKTCIKCGHGPMRVPGLLVRWFDLPHTYFKVSYCRGGADPHRTVTTWPDVEVEMRCAGIQEEHLHVGCGHCGYALLMETKEHSEKK